MDVEAWSQGSWNAFVVFECSKEVSRQRCREVPDRFKKVAISHATTYWKIQGSQPPPRQPGFAGMSKPYQDWTQVIIEPEHWAAGKAHLKGSNWQQMDKFGDQVMGFAAEHAVVDWFEQHDVDHNHSADPRGTDPDYTISGLTIDLKSVGSKGMPRPHYDANLAERQRLKDNGKIDWYLFGKYDNTTAGDFYILGFQTEQYILDNGAFYREGEITRQKMKAPRDCWCIRYDELIKPFEWLGEYK